MYKSYNHLTQKQLEVTNNANFIILSVGFSDPLWGEM